MTDRAEKSTAIQRTRDGSERGRERGGEGGFPARPSPSPRPTPCRGAEICKRLAVRWLDITQAHVRDGVRRTPPRPTEDTINLDTGRIKSRIYSPDTERETVLSCPCPCPVPSRPVPMLSCLSLSHTVWVGSSVMAVSRSIFLHDTHRGRMDRPISRTRTAG